MLARKLHNGVVTPIGRAWPPLDKIVSMEGKKVQSRKICGPGKTKTCRKLETKRYQNYIEVFSYGTSGENDFGQTFGSPKQLFREPAQFSQNFIEKSQMRVM